MYNSNCFCKIDFFVNHQKKMKSLEPKLSAVLSIDTKLGLFGLDGYVLLFQGGDHFTPQSFKQGVCLGYEG